MLGNGVVGILSESVNKWERRAPLTPSHCARILHSGRDKSGVSRIIVQPSTKRIHHDALYEDVGCEISDDLSACGLILGIKQPKLDMILPDRAYAFFSHTHKAQKENMPLLDKILAERVSLYDYELIVGDHGQRLLAFGTFAGRAGMIDFLRGLGQRYLNLGYSTPFLSLGASYMYPSLAAAKAAIISVGEEIATQGIPSGICPLVFVFTGSGNVSLGAQEIFKLLPHTFVSPSKLPELCGTARDFTQPARTSKRVFQVYGCVVTSQDMVKPKDPGKEFDKADYYAHPEHYKPIFHEKIAPYATVIVNCIYWEKRFPPLLTTLQLQDLMKNGCPLVGISDITCDIGGSIEYVNQTTSIDSPFFRYDPLSDSYHHDMDGNGLICLAVDILPTEFAKEASQHFGDILSQFIGSLASEVDITKLPAHLRRACIAHGGALTSLYEYIPRMRNSDLVEIPENLATSHSSKKRYNILVSLSGHLFDQFLINEALDIIEATGGSFHLVKCEVGQSTDAMSYSELEVSADDRAVLDQIIDSLTSLANPSENHGLNKETNKISLKVGKVHENGIMMGYEAQRKTAVLIIGAGRVCRPAAELLASSGSISSHRYKTCLETDFEEQNDVQVIVASLYLKDAEEIIEGIPNATAVQLDVMDRGSLCTYISQVEIVISLLPPSCHTIVANVCIELKKHLVTASYVNDSMLTLDEKAKSAGITILGEMGLDPGIDHMMAMKMINEAHARGGRIKSFVSYCGGLPSPAAANNPLAYKFSWNPAGAIRAGQNPATYRSHGEIVQVDGDSLYGSAVRVRIPDLPAFALECLPNRNSLVYGELYGIGHEASTIFRGTLRYEGFGKIMGSLARIGLFNGEDHPIFQHEKRTTFRKFLCELLNITSENLEGVLTEEKEIAERITTLGHCKEQETAVNAAKTIKFLGLHEQTEIPASCKSAFDVTCLRMEEKLAYASTEQDMVLLHHEVEVEFPDEGLTENHRATLLEFGITKNGRTTTAMALTVGIPAAIGALLLLENKIKTRGVLRPIEPEVYVPALDVLRGYGIKFMEKID
ncbi:AlaDh_PNT_C domain-containing protein/Saccharop_dh domain-containing protein/Saccharop_dh_N domain-containing protein/AlaDh_PNT_N domain-containing protein [Cephalotus follicularis]|uniref:AlaDh_PNT_C domain-containing protein/Saccharop_dh domain-containing protein/Saccharop_dh_N domain-containing protein/AlaDh_PNT_N domain-containing protein n=1 Tax=Cephalotus follicularis TaxID=3775 RepID=A0A1Q3C1G8_CEPFO|nr:AlaDh_PNT_C domain-containing protein/Saccharop_dh domain-containing protein/Saccharop_dh_N domain-containing protein/AlaDh_PNT_N domain-containing protein [Cephalotus follicularis]